MNFKHTKKNQIIKRRNIYDILIILNTFEKKILFNYETFILHFGFTGGFLL
jgi:hypothetical protein